MIERPAGDIHSLVGRLYDAHGASLYRYALMLLADRSAAEDAVQQVFTSLLRQGASSLDNEAHYLRRAVRNECYSMLRRPKLAQLDETSEPLLDAVVGSESSIEERLTLERAIRALPVEQREVVHLRAFAGMTFQEIADDAGESINTVASRYRYALDKLREHFDR